MMTPRFHTSPPPRPPQIEVRRRHVHGPIVPMAREPSLLRRLFGRLGA